MTGLIDYFPFELIRKTADVTILIAVHLRFECF
jgi:hypothetical protein